MNNIIDVPLNSLNNPGNLWINKASRQLRYSLDKDKPSSWLQPLSEYAVGNDSLNSAFIKRGQPVSIGFIDELSSELQISGDPCVVPTNPHIHQWCIGISLEPGNANLPINNGVKNDHVHVLSHGQIEYNLDDSRPNVYQPPNQNGKYLWTYEDIGKPVMVSNFPGEEGGLTIDITHAYFNGANIITVGRIADAPVPPGTPGMPSGQDEQKIVIEVQLAGDVRGMIDSTQFDVTLSEDVPIDKNGNQIEYIQSEDRLVFVKIVDDPTPGKTSKGIMITSDEVLLENGGLNSPLGCFLAKSKNGKVELKDYSGKTVLLHRLGIIEANFGYNESDLGKDLYLNNGQVITTGTSQSYEYKVGVVIESGRILVDCRYPRIFAKFEMIGKIKPAYTDRNTGNLIADPGYLIIDPTVVHKVSGVYPQDTQVPLVDFTELLKIIMYQQIVEFCDTPNGTYTDISGANTWNSIKDGYFKFKNVFYSLDGQVMSQIKFTNEGAPDNIQYIWPEMYFQATIPPGANSWTVDTSPISFNINYLYNLGAYIDGNGNNIEAYDIICKLPQEYGGRYISPGFYTAIDINGNNKWCGYEWAVKFFSALQEWRLVMVTNPGDPNNAVSAANTLGFCYPPGKQLSNAVLLDIVVRRRPVQYHNLFLNQLNVQNPWKPYTTGNDLVTDDTLYFGDMYSGIVNGNNETVWSLDRRGANAITFNNFSKTGAGNNTIYKKLLRYTVGPYFESELVATKRANQLVVQYQPVNLSGAFTSGYSINWTYDFDNNIAYLGAEFAPKLLSYPTTMDRVNSSGITEKYTIVHEDYIAGATKDNLSGYYDTPRSALKTLHEVPVQFFNYEDDVDKDHYRIHTVQEAWNISGLSTQRYQPANFEREIFPPVSGIYPDGTKYTYESSSQTNVKLQKEWEHIQEEINFLFNPILRDNNGNIEVGGDTTYIHTNLGLLNQASKETQDRLLKLERSLFGADYDTLPNGTNLTESYLRFKTIPETLHNGGVSRELSFLYDQKLIMDNFPTSDYKSDYNTILWELYGNYFNIETYINNAVASGYQFNLKNHFHDVYIWYLEQQDYKGKQYNPLTFRMLQDQNGYNNGAYNAKRIYFNKYYSGYYLEGDPDENFPKSKTFPFAWPIDLEDSSYKTNISPEERFFNINMVGLSDQVFYDDGSISGSIDATSLEGVMLDVISKLSFMRYTFEDKNHQFHPNYANMYIRNAVVPSGNLFILTKNFRVPKDSFSYDNYSNVENSTLDMLDKEVAPEYFSAFYMISGKINNYYSYGLHPDYYPDNITNLSRFNNKNVHLRTMPFERFDNSFENFGDFVSINGDGPVILRENYLDRPNKYYVWTNPPHMTSPPSGLSDITPYPKFQISGDDTPLTDIDYFPPTGKYITDTGDGTLWFKNKIPSLWENYSLIGVPIDDYKLKPHDVYFHFSGEVSGKQKISLQEYIQTQGVSQTNLGEFVMAHDNEFYFGESGYWYIRGTSGRLISGLYTFNNLTKSEFSGISGYSIKNGTSGYYSLTPGIHNKIDEKSFPYEYEIIEDINLSPNSTFRISGELTWYIRGVSGYEVISDNPYTTDYYISGLSGFVFSGYREVFDINSPQGFMRYYEPIKIEYSEKYIYEINKPGIPPGGIYGNPPVEVSYDDITTVKNFISTGQNAISILNSSGLHLDDGQPLNPGYNFRVIFQDGSEYNGNKPPIPFSGYLDLIQTSPYDYNYSNPVSKETIIRNSINFLDSINQGYVNYLAGISNTRPNYEAGNYTVDGRILIDIINQKIPPLTENPDSWELRTETPSENLPHMTGIIPIVEGPVEILDSKISGTFVFKGSYLKPVYISGAINVTNDIVRTPHINEINNIINNMPNPYNIGILNSTVYNIVLDKANEIMGYGYITIGEKTEASTYRDSLWNLPDPKPVDINSIYPMMLTQINYIITAINARNTSKPSNLSQTDSYISAINKLAEIITFLNQWIYIPNVSNLKIEATDKLKFLQDNSAYFSPAWDFNEVNLYIPNDFTAYVTSTETDIKDGSIKIESDTPVDVTAPWSHIISGKTIDMDKYNSGLQLVMDNMSGQIWLTSGRLVQRQATIESELNEQPVTLKLNFDQISGWRQNGLPNTVLPAMSGDSIKISGSVTYDRSGYLVSGYDIADGPISYEVNDVSGILQGKYNKLNYQSFRNWDWIKGKHLPDDVDINVRIKKQEHLVDSMGLILDGKQKSTFNYSEKDISELENTLTSIWEGYIVQINDKGTKFENYAYSIFVSTGDTRDDGPKYTFIGIADSNTFALLHSGDPCSVFIIPGIVRKPAFKTKKVGEITQLDLDDIGKKAMIITGVERHEGSPNLFELTEDPNGMIIFNV